MSGFLSNARLATSTLPHYVRKRSNERNFKFPRLLETLLDSPPCHYVLRPRDVRRVFILMAGFATRSASMWPLCEHTFRVRGGAALMAEWSKASQLKCTLRYYPPPPPPPQKKKKRKVLTRYEALKPLYEHTFRVRGGAALMAEWSKALPLTARFLSPPNSSSNSSRGMCESYLLLGVEPQMY